MLLMSMAFLLEMFENVQKRKMFAILITENTQFKETKITVNDFVIHCDFRDIVHCHLNQVREYYLQ